MVKELLKACLSLKAQSTQLNPRSLRGGPVAQDQTSSQQENRKGQSPLRGATVRTVHYFNSTAQPQVSNRSGAGLMLWLVSGCRVGGGGRPVTMVKDSSLRTQAVNPKKGWNLQGKDP